MYAFDYHRPDSLRKAVNLAARVEDAKFLAGGHTLLPTMKQRLASPAALIDLNKVTELSGIELRGRTVVIGAMTRHAAVEQSPELQQALPALAELAHLIGDPQVRHRGTIGGSIANNDPAADYPAACLALGATIVTTKRKLTADEFFTGLFETALDDGEIITKVIFPVVSRAAYEKFRNPASRYALAGVFVAKRGSDIRVAVTGAGENGVFRLPEFEAALKVRFSPKSIDGLKVSPDGLIGDIHADPAYRAQLVAVMARRAVAKAAARRLDGATLT
ncbi:MULTISPECIES: xanthine dehydrogenase family protein subunit M [unclassified Chelatococcus]|uniref:FAD binding domain-containing protein n=1 Tax=unclassified Chelatococcus TaxID=2638111 RepID=UPI001BCE8021|nr:MULTISPECIES: xanthine dehydrogenase family protein subunit M [unclassified Chelatococcus]MBS7698078.1 xanthine dehydrogenase family protein subunit M [Chelatococcus sp. YT9]MBX3556604.1 xanthine dehydrogenase family protein subunit M [Chelatococcus sp.]